MPKYQLTQQGRDLFYQRALVFERPFRIKELVRDPSEEAAARLWLHEVIDRGEMRKTNDGLHVLYEWIND